MTADHIIFEISLWIFRVFLVVFTICTIAIWLLLPAHNGTFTRAFRHLFGALSLLMIHTAFFRFGGYQAMGLDDSVRIVVSTILFGACIATAPRAMIAAYGARSSYRSEITRLAAATKVSAHETESLATQAREAVADEEVTHGTVVH